jgi:hypothetical protein
MLVDLAFPPARLRRLLALAARVDAALLDDAVAAEAARVILGGVL